VKIANHIIVWIADDTQIRKVVPFGVKRHHYRNFEVYVQNAPLATMEPERLKEVV
jgi:hypothetical protein